MSVGVGVGLGVTVGAGVLVGAGVIVEVGWSVGDASKAAGSVLTAEAIGLSTGATGWLSVAQLTNNKTKNVPDKILNGIKCCCSDMDISPRRLPLSSPQIIIGLEQMPVEWGAHF
jgi:hypothetical protein